MAEWVVVEIEEGGMMEDNQKRIEETALAIPGQAGAITIASDKDLEEAGYLLTNIKGVGKKIKAFFDPIIQKAHSAHKEAVAQKKKALAPLVEAEGIIKPKIAAYTAEQERIQRAEEERLRREAEEKRKAEEEKRLEEIVALELAGKTKEAVVAMEQPEPVALPIAAPPKPKKVTGVAIKKIWKFRIIDESKIPREYMIPNEKMIGAMVRTQKEKCNIPGIEVYTEDSVAARG